MNQTQLLLSLWRSVPGLLCAPVLLGALLSCSSKKDEGSDSSGLKPIDVCVSALKCGKDCSKTSDCPSGEFCSDSQCTAECTAALGCNGVCRPDGHCDGERQMQAATPSESEGDVLITDPSDVSGDLASCATGTANGEMTPVTMYVMFDRSSSMRDNDKWGRATAGLEQFLKAKESANLSVVYGVFPTETGGCNKDECVAATCGEPLVPLGTLTADSAPGDAQEDALVSAIEADDPSGGGLGTPTGAAMQGALDWAVQYQGGHADESAVVVLVTDGEPDGCGDIGELERIASNGFMVNGIRTYAIGLQGSQEQTMDRIAQAGGTGQGIFIGNGDATSDLLAALNTIRGEAATCNIELPKGDVDLNNVNVTLTLAGKAYDLGRVDDDKACADDGAWYYDDNDNPTRLLLCPNTCTAVQKDTAPEIKIVLGCPRRTTGAPLAR